MVLFGEVYDWFVVCVDVGNVLCMMLWLMVIVVLFGLFVGFIVFSFIMCLLCWLMVVMCDFDVNGVFGVLGVVDV